MNQRSSQRGARRAGAHDGFRAALGERSGRLDDRGLGLGARRAGGLVEVSYRIGGIDDLEPLERVTQSRPDLGLGAEQETAGATGGCLTGRRNDLADAAVGSERVYCDGCDGPSSWEVSATTCRPP
jgi:hypothetical protein